MLSRRAVAIAQASQSNRVDCVGTSKGLFFGLLILVGATICLILFFVLIHQPDLGLLAIYLAEGSHCAIVALSIVASLIGFIRIRKLKFRVEQPTNLNDILLRISAFGLFVYMAFNIISGSTYFLVSQPDLLIVVTATLTIVQVVLQLLFIGNYKFKKHFSAILSVNLYYNRRCVTTSRPLTGTRPLETGTTNRHVPVNREPNPMDNLYVRWAKSRP